MAEYKWEEFDNPKVIQLRNDYHLVDVIASGKNEFEKQLLLKKWIFQTLPLGYNNQNQYKTAFDVLSDKTNPGGFNCTWFVLVYLQCAISLGWYARKWGIDTDHDFGQEEKRHTVIDIWSSKFNKWYVIDPMFNTHFESFGVPLNAYEIRNSYFRKEKVNRIFGVYENEVLPSSVKDKHGISENYFWQFVYLRNNFFEDQDIYNSKALLWEDDFNKNKTWFVGGVGKGEFKKHPMYKSSFIKSDDLSLFYPSMSKK